MPPSSTSETAWPGDLGRVGDHGTGFATGDEGSVEAVSPVAERLAHHDETGLPAASTTAVPA